MKIIKAKSVQAFRPDPFVATILNCSLWMFYGLPIVHPDSFLLITINGAGFIIEVVFITIFFTYSTWSTAVVAVTLTCFHTYASRSMVVGLLCIVINILMYESPLTVMVPNALGTLSAIVQLVL
ncbi:hypothetical protein L1987_44890 [Smallanthus sonchifolius]|uniref:Uncharacterized protein n=1 Tax=Smallanthus sonchifolius TaxID=185202 RepID=A0ACB9GRZ3_9ASTR|nr:hypothetical protein L1987_44890 [Smallanthus sonchifolius]